MIVLGRFGRRILAAGVLIVCVATLALSAADNYPSCRWGCNAKDAEVVQVWAEVSGGSCATGQPTTITIYVTFTNHMGKGIYALRLLADLYVDGALAEHIDQCLGDAGPGQSSFVAGIVDTTCSTKMELRDVVLSYSTNSETCSDTPACSARAAHCWAGAGTNRSVPVVNTFLSVGLTGPSTVCLGAAAAFADTTSGGKTPYRYLWDFGDGATSTTASPSHKYTAPGDYTVSLTATDSSGATNTARHDLVVAEPPAATADNGGPYCPGQTIALYADGGASYRWTGPSGFSSSVQNPTIPRAGAANAGTYTVIVTDAFSCTAQASTVILLDATPPTLGIPPDATVECDEAYDPSVAGEATAFDNEDPAPTVTYADLVTLGSCGGAKRVQRTWTAADACGNRVTALQTINLIDTTPPTLRISDATFECDGSANVSDIATWLASAKASDACGPVTITNDFDGVSARCSGTGMAQVTFTATDVCGNVTEETATLRLVGTIAPDAVDDLASTSEDNSVLVNVLGNDSDRCQGDLTIVSVTTPTFGDATIVGDAVEYTPSADANGAAEFRYTIEDCAGHRDVALVRITVAPVNDAPVAVDQAATLSEDTSAALKVTGTDVDRDALTFAIGSGPQNGTLTGLNPTTGAVTYTPDQDYNGPDSFTLTICDPSGSCDEGTVTLTVRPVNDAPGAVDLSGSLSEDGSLALRLSGTDADGDALTFVIAAGPANGTLVGFNPKTGAVTYVPDSNCNGPDSFTFTVCDPSGACDTGTATLSVRPINDAPAAVDQTTTVNEDAPLLLHLAGTDVDGDALTFAIVDGPTNGAVVGLNPATGAVTYTPDPNYNGPDSFTFTVCDPSKTCAMGTVTLTIQPVNDAPVAVDQTEVLSENGSLEILLEGTDVDGDALTFSIVSDPAHGTLVGFDPATGAVTYVPDHEYSGPDSFTYAVCDPSGACDTGTIALSVVLVDDMVTAVDQAGTLDEDGSLAIQLAGADVDGDMLPATLLAGPEHGTLVGFNPATGTATYVPDSDYNGLDSFTFTACDEVGVCDEGTVTLTIRPVNDAPVAVDQTDVLSEDGSLAVQIEGIDADGDALTFAILAGPAHGTLSGFDPATGALTYTPSPDYNGPDSFTFTVCDPSGACDTGTVTLSVTPVNDSPVAVDQAVTLSEDGSLALQLVGTDVDGDVLTFAILAGPTHGTLIAFDSATGTATYVPDANYNGPDSFTFTVCGPSGACDTGTVTLSIDAMNDVPVAVDQTDVLSEDGSLVIQLEGVDVDGDALAFTILTGPAHGTLVGVDSSTGTVTYTPNADYNGPDSFTFAVCDPSGACGTGTVALSVTPVNDPPVAVGTAGTLNEDSLLAVQLVGTDVDGDVLTFAVLTGPGHGTLVGLDPATGAVTYVPNPDYNGADSFTFTVCGPSGACATGTVTLSVAPVNDAPAAAAQSVWTREDEVLPIQLAGSDVDGDAIVFAIVLGPNHGTLVGFNSATGTVTYVPEPNSNGLDSFIFSACDPSGACSPATVTVSVAAVNDAPVAANQAAVLDEDGSLTVQFGGTDADGDALTFTIVGAPTHGTLVGFDPATGAVIYVPGPDYNGSDSFTFMVCDPADACDTGSVTLSIRPVNDAPSANDEATTVSGTSPNPLTLTASDSDGDAVIYRLLSLPEHGTILDFDGTTGTLTYVAASGYEGSDVFTFEACDPSGACGAATISLLVAATAHAPVTEPQAVSTSQDTPLEVVLHATDANGDPITYSILGLPMHGSIRSLDQVSGDLIYVPDRGFSGEDLFTFEACNPSGACAASFVTVTVLAVNEPPTATSFETTVTAGVPVDITLMARDPEGDPVTFTIVEPPSHGTVVLFDRTSGHLVFLPDEGYAGPDVIVFRACDPSGACGDGIIQTFAVLTAGGGGAIGACDRHVVISEVAWAGTEADSTNEWIELQNVDDSEIDLAGWTLRWRPLSTSSALDGFWRAIGLSGTMGAFSGSSRASLIAAGGGWFRIDVRVEPTPDVVLLERATDDVVSNVLATQVYVDTLALGRRLDLPDAGGVMELVDSYGCIVDRVSQVGQVDGWPAGNAAPPASMQRDERLVELAGAEWSTNWGPLVFGHDKSGNLVLGTPGTVNPPPLGEILPLLPAEGARAIPIGAVLAVALPGEPSAWTTGPAMVRLTDRVRGELAIPASELLVQTSGVGGAATVIVGTSDLPAGEYALWVRSAAGMVYTVLVTVLP